MKVFAAAILFAGYAAAAPKPLDFGQIVSWEKYVINFSYKNVSA